jgi:hypothetical protein
MNSTNELASIPITFASFQRAANFASAWASSARYFSGENVVDAFARISASTERCRGWGEIGDALMNSIESLSPKVGTAQH